MPTGNLNRNSFFQNQNPVGTTPIFNLTDVSVAYGRFLALKNVNLTVQKGEILFLTGPSGAGKTTLLKVLAEEIKPNTGRASFFLNEKDFVARIFQDLRLLNHLTIEQNLLLSFDPSIYKNKNEFIKEMIEISKLLGFYNNLSLKVKSANGGLKQLVAFSRTLLSRPDVILADEPTCSLDFDNAKRVFDILNLYNTRRGLTVVWASHNRELVSKFTGRIVHLDGGKLVYSGHACFI